MYAFNSQRATISCSIESRNRTVTFPASKFSESIVTQKGVPISSIRAYLFPTLPASSYSHEKSSDRSAYTFLASSESFFTTGRTHTFIGASFGSSLRYDLSSSCTYASLSTARKSLVNPTDGSIT